MATSVERSQVGATSVMNSDVPIAIGVAIATAMNAMRMVNGMTAAMPKPLPPASGCHSEVVRNEKPDACSACSASQVRNTPTDPMIASTRNPLSPAPRKNTRSPVPRRDTSERGSVRLSVSERSGRTVIVIDSTGPRDEHDDHDHHGEA